LGKGSFGDAGADKVTFRGLRIFVEIEKVTNTPAVALVRIYGLSLSRINQLTKAGLNWEGYDNSILIEAGDKGGQLNAIFQGQIFTAEPEFDMPDTSLLIMANAGRSMQMKPVPPNTFKGGVSTEVIMSKMAQQAGCTLENNGVTAQHESPYFPGTIWSQLDLAARAANCFFFHDSIKKTIAIWPKTGSRSGEVPLVASETGAIGYPRFSATMITVKTLFNPKIQIGVPIEVRSQLTAASGKWSVTLAGHSLASQMPNGQWETHATAVRAGA
jgi:hypothetical protein